jgi:hypothetical protein
MAFSGTVTGKSVFGNKKIRMGTFASTSGSQGGDINVGLSMVEYFTAIVNSTSTASAKVAVNETFPVSGAAITLVTDANATGYWQALGR